MSFIILLIYIIVIYLRPAEWVPWLMNYQLLDFCAIIGILTVGVTITSTKERVLKGPQDGLMLGFFFAILMSHLSHTYMGGVIDAFTRFGKILVMYFLFVHMINSEKKFRIAVWLIILLTAVMAVQGVYQFYTGMGLGGQVLQTYSGIPRITWIGIFDDPNDLALAFVMASGILLALLFGQAKGGVKIVALLLLGLFFYGIYLTNSRGGMLALGVTMFFYFVRRTRRLIAGGIIGCVCIALLFVLGPSRMQIVSADEESAYSRLDLWYEGIQMVKSNPLFGVGFDLFMDDQPLTAHNSFVLALAELGFFGYFIFIALFYASFRGLSRIQEKSYQLIAENPRKKYDRRPPPELPLMNYALGLQAGIIGFAASAFFLSRTYKTLPYIFFALATGLFHVSRFRMGDIDNTFTKRDFRNVMMLGMGLVAFIWVMMKMGL